MTNDQITQLKEAVYKIADAKSLLDDLNSQLSGQADIAALCSNLDSLTETKTGGIGSFLKSL